MFITLLPASVLGGVNSPCGVRFRDTVIVFASRSISSQASAQISPWRIPVRIASDHMFAFCRVEHPAMSRGNSSRVIGSGRLLDFLRGLMPVIGFSSIYPFPYAKAKMAFRSDMLEFTVAAVLPFYSIFIFLPVK